ncbi:MAG: hypothetical protein IT361_03515 [Gemmatimonadaceae bacterium]|nr:hypothetical protein [Gemmatimonadaceae bacterium]
MRLTPRVVRMAASNVRVPSARVLVRREAIWRSPAPVARERVELTYYPPERLVSSSFVAYGAAPDVATFEDTVLPVAGALRYSRSHVLVGFVVHAASFDARFLRVAMERCHGLGFGTIVEIAGEWGTSALELLWALRPLYLRLGPDHVRGVHVIPEQLHSVLRLAAFAEYNRVPMVVRGAESPEERTVLRNAGLELYHVTESGSTTPDPLRDFGPAGSVRTATVLQFPAWPAEG